MAWVFLVDCLLAPVGLLAAIVATEREPRAVLLVLPLMLLMRRVRAGAHGAHLERARAVDARTAARRCCSAT